MRLDSRAIRYLSPEDWRVLTAVEMGSRNHELVPTPLIGKISGCRSLSGIQKSISILAKLGLIAKMKNANYDGYRLSYGGLDYLALNAHRKKGTILGVGMRIGVGKESDVCIATDSEGQQVALKIHRLGRISFRSVKNNRDYLRGRSTGSWMYMSRLAATKEYACMEALHKNNFRVPDPLSSNRHTIVMSWIDGVPLRKVHSVPDPSELYEELVSLVMRLAKHGLIHGDFNEFNIMVENSSIQASGTSDYTSKSGYRVVLIDFPQMVSIDHPNAEFYFDRDIECIKRFFKSRFHFVPSVSGPHLQDALREVADDPNIPRLDIEVEASGFSRKMAKELENYRQQKALDGDGDDHLNESSYEGDGDGDDHLNESSHDADSVQENGCDSDFKSINTYDSDLIPDGTTHLSPS